MKKIAVKKNIILLNILWISPMLTKNTHSHSGEECVCVIFLIGYIFVCWQRQIKLNSEIAYSTMNFIVLPTLKTVGLFDFLPRQNLKRVSQICSVQSGEELKKETWSWTRILSDSIITTAQKNWMQKSMYTNSGTVELKVLWSNCAKWDRQLI